MVTLFSTSQFSLWKIGLDRIVNGYNKSLLSFSESPWVTLRMGCILMCWKPVVTGQWDQLSSYPQHNSHIPAMYILQIQGNAVTAASIVKSVLPCLYKALQGNPQEDETNNCGLQISTYRFLGGICLMWAWRGHRCVLPPGNQYLLWYATICVLIVAYFLSTFFCTHFKIWKL